MFKLFRALSENKQLTTLVQKLKIENKNASQKIEQLQKELTQTRSTLGKVQIRQSEALAQQRDLEDRMSKARKGYRDMQLRLQASEQNLLATKEELLALKTQLKTAESSSEKEPETPPVNLKQPRPAKAPEDTHILLIDDSLTTQTLMKRVLEGADYQVTVAKDGSEGQNLAQQLIPDLIIVDEKMPQMDGYQLNAWLKTQSEIADTPVLLMTSHVNDDFKEKLQAADIQGYINKADFNQDSFLKVVKGTLSHA